MKKLLIMFAMTALLGSCATTSPAKLYPRLTADNVRDTCEATETWSIRVMPMPVAIVRFTAGCGGVRDLLLLVSPVGEFTEDQRELTAQLVISYYMVYLEGTQPQPSKKWQAALIKREINTSDTDGKRAFYYYAVTSQKSSSD